MMIADDLQRPAAIDQHCTSANSSAWRSNKEDGVKDAVRVAKNGIKYAKDKGYEAVILDTAGRLHIDEE